MAIYEARIEQAAGYQQTTPAESFEQNPVVRLEGKSTMSLRRRLEVIRVISGSAWITFDGRDLVVYNGEEITLTRGKDDAVIASLDGQPLVLSITR